jgi:hypothetical protein
MSERRVEAVFDLGLGRRLCEHLREWILSGGQEN